MTTRRNRRTDLDMKNSGVWAMTGKKAWAHMDGGTVVYDCNRWLWIVGNCGKYTGDGYTTLDVARHVVEMEAAKRERGAATLH